MKSELRKRIAGHFRLKLKHVLGGVSLLSLLAAFEIFSVPAGNGISLLLNLNRISAGEMWVEIAVLSGMVAYGLHKLEKNK